MLTVTPYVTTLLAVVADGSIAVTLPVAVVPLSAFQVIVAACLSLSLVASASAKAAVTWSFVRSARSTNPELEPEPDPVFGPLWPDEPWPPEAPDEPEAEPELEPDPPDELPSVPLTAVTVP